MPTIVWDVDDVLNDLMAAWFKQDWLPSHPESALAYGDIRENPPHTVLGIKKQEYLASLDAFRLSARATEMTPNQSILQWFREHGGKYRHMALTARPLETAPPAAEWVFRHFGTYVRCFGVVPSRMDPSVPLYDRNKADFLEWFRGADIFIDDNEENVATVQAVGVKSILFPQPWNKSRLTVEGILQMLTDHVVLN